MKKIISIALCICICLTMMSAITAFADDSLCGDKINWSFNNGVLTISGSGEMYDYALESDVPWYSIRNNITTIVVEDGVTYIGDMAFYGCVNAATAKIAKSVEKVGLSAFSYTEGSRTSISNVNSAYKFIITSDVKQAKAGDEFYITITLDGDMKNVSVIQNVLVYDNKRLSTDIDNWYDKDWYDSINENNLGYISKPLAGIVSNTFRVAYISTQGYKIDKDSPLYNAGEITSEVAKIKFKALTDINTIDMSCFYLKDSAVMIADTDANAPECSVTQLTSSTVLPLNKLTILTDSAQIKEFAEKNNIKCMDSTYEPADTDDTPSENAPDAISVYIDGQKLEFDVDPILFEDKRTLVPMRAIFEYLHAVVFWDNETNTALGSKDDTTICFQIDNNKMIKNGETIELDVPAKLINDRTLVPIRAISESFNCNVDWIDSTKSVVITTK